MHIILTTTCLPVKMFEFVENSIAELLESERKNQVFYKPVVLNPLSVSVQPKGKKRSILDFRYVNRLIKRLWIKYDDWKIASLTFQKNGYTFSFDVKSGFHLCQDLPTGSDILRFFMGF